jgi:hypothetical protein
MGSNHIYLERYIINKKSSFSYCTWREIGVVLRTTAQMKGCSG